MENTFCVIFLCFPPPPALHRPAFLFAHRCWWAATPPQPPHGNVISFSPPARMRTIVALPLLKQRNITTTTIVVIVIVGTIEADMLPCLRCWRTDKDDKQCERGRERHLVLLVPARTEQQQLNKQTKRSNQKLYYPPSHWPKSKESFCWPVSPRSDWTRICRYADLFHCVGSNVKLEESHLSSRFKKYLTGIIIKYFFGGLWRSLVEIRFSRWN